MNYVIEYFAVIEWHCWLIWNYCTVHVVYILYNTPLVCHHNQVINDLFNEEIKVYREKTALGPLISLRCDRLQLQYRYIVGGDPNSEWPNPNSTAVLFSRLVSYSSVIWDQNYSNLIWVLTGRPPGAQWSALSTSVQCAASGPVRSHQMESKRNERKRNNWQQCTAE